MEERKGENSLLSPFAHSPLRRLWLCLPPLAAVWLYGRALGFAYFNDDPTGHFAWMEGQSLWQFFSGSADYGYYRPVVFAVLRLSELLFGNATLPHHPVADHALLLLLHVANTALVGALALALVRRAGRSPAYAGAAALLFALVPFSYEAVGYVASLTHPLLLFWTLLAITSYDWRMANGERAVNSSLVMRQSPLLFLCLGLLTHENGLFIFPALVGYDWATRPEVAWPARARRLWVYAIPPVLFVGLWLLIPKNSAESLNGLSDVGRNLVPFLQTLVYPLLSLARLDAGDTTALVVLAAAAVAVSGLLARRVGAARIWAFGLGWWGLALLPSVLFLDPAYVYGSPRLSYLPSVGVALLWGLPVLALERRRRSATGRLTADIGPAAMALITVIYSLILVLPPLPFIRCQLDFYDETSRLARAMAAVGHAAPAGRDLLFVNLPFFFSSTAARPDGCPAHYSWTPTGGILIPPYAQPRDFVRFNGGPARTAAGVTFADYGPGWRTFGDAIDDQTLRRHATEDAVYVFDLNRGDFADLSAAWQPGAAAAGESRASFGGILELIAARLETAGDELTVGLAWRVSGAAGQPLAAFVHVYDVGGGLVAQSDGPPGNGLVPPGLWVVGDGLGDTRRIELSGAPPGAYRVAVGVYRLVDGTRLPASAAEPLADDIYNLGWIER